MVEKGIQREREREREREGEAERREAERGLGTAWPFALHQLANQTVKLLLDMGCWLLEAVWTPFPTRCLRAGLRAGFRNG